MSNLLNLTGFFVSLSSASMRVAYFLAYFFYAECVWTEKVQKYSDLARSVGFWLAMSFVFVCLSITGFLKTNDYTRSASMGASSRRELQN